MTMDAPLASRCSEWFMKGYMMQAKKEEEEAVKIVKTLNYDALKALCTRYENKIGTDPMYKHEGKAILAFFEELRDNVMEKEKMEEL